MPPSTPLSPEPWAQIKPVPKKNPTPVPTMIQRVYRKPKPTKLPPFIKNTKPTNAVLKHIASSPRGDYGYNIRNTLILSNGTIYAILQRLEAFGWIESWWAYAPIDPNEKPLRRPRKYYEITPLGLEKAQERKLV